MHQLSIPTEGICGDNIYEITTLSIRAAESYALSPIAPTSKIILYSEPLGISDKSIEKVFQPVWYVVSSPPLK